MTKNELKKKLVTLCEKDIKSCTGNYLVRKEGLGQDTKRMVGARRKRNPFYT